MVCGEVGLAGEVRAVGQMEMRLREAGRLGFKTFLMPESSTRQLKGKSREGMRVVPVRTVAELADYLFRVWFFSFPRSVRNLQSCSRVFGLAQSCTVGQALCAVARARAAVSSVGYTARNSPDQSGARSGGDRSWCRQDSR